MQQPTIHWTTRWLSALVILLGLSGYGCVSMVTAPSVLIPRIAIRSLEYQTERQLRPDYIVQAEQGETCLQPEPIQGYRPIVPAVCAVVHQPETWTFYFEALR